MEFRDWPENGVLLGISSAKVDAIGLEIVDGKVDANLDAPPPRHISSQCQREQLRNSRNI